MPDLTFHQVVISEIADEVPAVVSLRLQRANGQAMTPFAPGSHVELQIPNGSKRSYSICSDPADLSHYSLGVLLEPNSRGGSSFIHDSLEAGDVLLMSDPKASFALSKDATRHAFIAGGIGITPFLAMMHHLKREGADFTVHYLAKDQDRACFLSDVRQIAGDRLKTYWSGKGERFEPAQLESIGQDARTQIYCCGPRKLMDAVLAASQGMHRPIRFETFVETATTEIYAGNAFEVQIASSGKIVSVKETQTMLEALRENGQDVASSCEHGICGTCVVRVLKGNPVHRDGVLSEELRKIFVAPCISRSKERLVLDL